MQQLILTFVGGGTLCLAAQLLIDLTRLTPAKILVFYVSAGVLIYAVGAYEPLFSVFGSGVSVPLVGFGASIAKGVRGAVDSEGILGVLTGGLSACSSGITAALLAGLFASVFFKSGAKRM